MTLFKGNPHVVNVLRNLSEVCVLSVRTFQNHLPVGAKKLTLVRLALRSITLKASEVSSTRMNNLGVGGAAGCVGDGPYIL